MITALAIWLAVILIHGAYRAGLDVGRSSHTPLPAWMRSHIEIQRIDMPAPVVIRARRYVDKHQHLRGSIDLLEETRRVLSDSVMRDAARLVRVTELYDGYGHGQSLITAELRVLPWGRQ